MKLLSLFSGIGAFEKALDRLEIPYELVGYCEIDKYASKSYAAIHGVDESMNIGDITKVDEKALPKDIDLITYGFPCQDISISGKKKGLFNEDGTHTRSGLFFEALRIIEETQPRIAIAENVKNLTSKKFAEQFKICFGLLEAAGYNNYWQILNAKDFGVPQNRERVFIVSIRKDIDTGLFNFPEGFPLELRLKDILEDVVDEKYYISKKVEEGLCNIHLKEETDETKDNATKLGNVYSDKFTGGGDFGGNVWDKNGLAPTIKTSAAASQQFVIVREATSCNQAVVEPVCLNSKGGRAGIEGLQPSIQDRVYDSNAISPALTTGFRPSYAVHEPTINRVDITQTVKVRKYEVDTDGLCKLLRESKSKVGLTNKDISDEVNVPVTMVEHWFRQDDCFSIPDSEIWMKLKAILKIETYEFDESIMTFEEREGVFERSERHYMSDGIAPTLTRTTAAEKIIEPSLRIRKLTPKECFRLMDFDDEDFDKAEAVNSNTQLYKQAGNSIVVACPCYIFKALIEANILIEKEKKEMELKVENYQLPERISFNFEELKAELEARVHMYEVMFYADDQIKEAKADRASLNKLKKALNDERIRMEKEYMVPFNEFKARINEIIAIIDKPVEMIDKQVKAYEDKQKQDKLDAIITFFNEQNHLEWLHFSQIFDERWLNASMTMKSVQDAISAELVRITTDLTTLHSLPEFGFEATEVYKSTLDINKAISEGHRLLEIAQKKAEFESTQAAKLAEQMAEVEAAKVVEEVAVAEEVLPEIEPVHTWIAFEANMTIDDAIELRKFFDSRHIEFRALYA